jgi:nucleoside-diphosphate-sugar epimerase
MITTLKASAISPGDKVLVIGGTGGVGQLTVGKLQGRKSFEVRTTSRDKKRGEEVIADSDVEVFEVDLVSEGGSALEAAMEGVAAVVISVGTTAFPTARWKGGNTPKAIDEEAVTRIAEAAAKVDTMKKIVLVTSVGVDRTKEMPFLILNLFGVLDAKKSGEQAIAAAAAKGGFDYVVIRPGRLVGGPFTNLDVSKLLQVQGGENH